MASHLAEAHITAQERLRALAVAGVIAIWAGLPGYDQENVDEWLTRVLPLIAAAQRQSIALTDAYLARAVEGPAAGVGLATIIAAVRPGVAPEEQWRRPFVTIWAALKEGTIYADAVNAGRARATSAAATDVQLAMRETLREVGRSNDLILGYRRVPDADACTFCRLVAGQRYRTDQLLPIHPRCGCGVDVITEANRGDFAGNRANDLSVPGAAVRIHGELGPVLVDPADSFQSL